MTNVNRIRIKISLNYCKVLKNSKQKTSYNNYVINKLFRVRKIIQFENRLSGETEY